MRFFGLEFSCRGVNPDPEKIAAISQLQTPTDAVQLREFLGIATYIAPFAPNLSQHTAILRELLKNDTDFQWTPSPETAFKTIKRLICKEITVSYFDPRAETHVQVGASSHDLGAVLIQNVRQIAFAPKSLSDHERRYANIEREMLALVFGCERFHTYVYGKQFTIQSDHKPLEMIHLKNLAAAPSVYRGCYFAFNRTTSSSGTSQARRWCYLTQCHDNLVAMQRAWHLPFRSVTCNSRLKSGTNYDEKQGTTTSY